MKINDIKEDLDSKKPKETSEITDSTWAISLPKTRIHTLDELVEYCKVDLSIWTVERFIVNKWEVGAKTSEGKIEVSPLFQVKAFLVKNKDLDSAKKEIESLKELAKQHNWPVSIEDNQYRPAYGRLLEINIPDLHVGKLAWGVETGGPNYDVKIAESTFWRALETLLSRVSGYKFDQVLLVIGNDLLNSDDIEGRTTAGTYVSTDARYHKTFVVTRTMIIKAIERLKQIAPVFVLPVPGNHDQLSVWHLGDSVEMFFTNDSQVSIDNRPRARKYFTFGKVLLMFCHGDKGRRTDYPLVMEIGRAHV